jgi:hypothetical protein
MTIRGSDRSLPTSGQHEISADDSALPGFLERHAADLREHVDAAWLRIPLNLSTESGGT